jgi:Zn/Cd-binding protein ZinT
MQDDKQSDWHTNWQKVLTYVDDIIVRRIRQEDHISDLQQTFAYFLKSWSEA